jgi:hypothetical protein
MVKSAKGKDKKIVKSKGSSSSSSSSSSSNSSSSSVIDSSLICSPPSITNGAKKKDTFVLTNDEQRAFRLHKAEIKQLSALIILKCGLRVQECKIISQKMQEEHFSKNFEKVYQVMTKDPIIGQRLSRIPVKYLTIGTSTAREVMSGTVLRKKYSAIKSYMNNTLSYLWRQ